MPKTLGSMTCNSYNLIFDHAIYWKALYFWHLPVPNAFIMYIHITKPPSELKLVTLIQLHTLCVGGNVNRKQLNSAPTRKHFKLNVIHSYKDPTVTLSQVIYIIFVIMVFVSQGLWDHQTFKFSPVMGH